jgi:TonB family protein
MSSPQPRAHRRVPAIAVSLACHAAAFAVLVAGATRVTLNLPQPSKLCCVAALQVAGGSRAVRLPLPEAPAASHSAKHPPVQEPITRPASAPHDRHPARASGTNAPAAQPSDVGTNSVAGNGSDAQNTTPAFPVFYPNPAVHDRTLLPASDRQVVVDVRLTAGGEVVSDNLVKGIGNALDGMAIEIVKTWRFQPATIDGKAVPSEAEVIFSFSQRYPISDS